MLAGMEPVPDSSSQPVPGPMGAAELAHAAGVHLNTVLADIRRGTLRARRSGRAYIIEAADAAAYIAARDLVAKGDAALAGLRQRAAERRKKPHG